jgi:hypothetical protein
MRIRTVLVPQEVAEICFLSEALMWTAFKRFPPSVTVEGREVRREFDGMDGLSPNFHEDIPNDAECAFAGLPSRPTHEGRLFEVQHEPPEHIRRSLEASDIPQRYRESLQRELEDSIEFHAAKSLWEEGLKGLLDLHQTRLFMALREGKLEAEGVKLPEKTSEASLAKLDQKKREGWSWGEWVSIPPDFWRSTGINWRQSWAEGRHAAYALIQVRTGPLFDCFPPSEPDGSNAVKVGHSWMPLSTQSAESRVRTNRGRPPYDWDSFHVEVAARIQADGLPAKQEAFIADMQEWCLKEWRCKVGRSTVLQKINPYYVRFVKNSR